jgi:PHD/YefM family antitoxin component YafN of YafNO toxin-antitoxin module
MKKITASYARANLFKLLEDIAADDGDPQLIHSKKGDCVLLSEQEWRDMNETIYLMTNPSTRKDILYAMKHPLSESVQVEL